MANQAPTVAVVGVATAWVSKINWAQLISLAAVILGIWNIAISQELQTNLVIGIFAFAGLIDVLTIVFRTFFTKTVTPDAVSGSPVIPAQTPVPVTTVEAMSTPAIAMVADLSDLKEVA